MSPPPPTIPSDAEPRGNVDEGAAPVVDSSLSANSGAILVDQPAQMSPGNSAPFKKQRVLDSADPSAELSADPPAPTAASAEPASAVSVPAESQAGTAAAAGAAPAAHIPASVPAALPAYVPPPHAEAAWAHFRRLGSPRLLVAPMVDQSELPFRLLCGKYGAQGAYTPMFHSRLFVEDHKYRKEFTTCKEDRPLFVQFCANNPDTLVKAASLVAADCDYIDLNLGCPQRIARRGRYGAFLMDDLPLVESLVLAVSSARLAAPISCKIRVFPDLDRTIAYARMLEAAGCYLLAVHGRTREQKDGKKVRADWEAIRQVKQALSIPVIANGNIRDLGDVVRCLEATGADGVLSAESLLENPALFGGYGVEDEDEGERGGDGEGEETAAAAMAMETDLLPTATTEAAVDVQRLLAAAVAKAASSSGSGSSDGDDGKGRLTTTRISLAEEYLALCDAYPVPMRMIRSHLHRLLGPVFSRHPHVREKLNKEYKLTVPWLQELVGELKACVRGQVGGLGVGEAGGAGAGGEVASAPAGDGAAAAAAAAGAGNGNGSITPASAPPMVTAPNGSLASEGDAAAADGRVVGQERLVGAAAAVAADN